MSFLGPRPLTPTEAAAVPPEGLVRFWIRPGIVSAYRLRKGIGVAYKTEYQLDHEFYYRQSLGGDIGLLAGPYRAPFSVNMGSPTPRRP
jgi:N-acetylglucosaminyldiphosphoundecaprenol N-acetyl-beta-D-mannosaminyltransferase